MCSTRGRPSNRSSTIACTSVVHSSARRTSPTRSHDESIEQKLLPTTLMSCTSPAAIAASAASSRSKPSCTRPCVTSARPLSASARTSSATSSNSAAIASARSALAQEFVDVGALARHERELEVTPLRARSDLFEQPAGAVHPPVAGGGVAERVRMQLGEVDRDPRRRAQLTGAAQARERVLPLLAGFGEPVVHVRDARRAARGRAAGPRARSRSRAARARFRRRPRSSAIPASSRSSVAPLTTEDRRGRARGSAVFAEGSTKRGRQGCATCDGQLGGVRRIGIIVVTAPSARVRKSATS